MPVVILISQSSLDQRSSQKPQAYGLFPVTSFCVHVEWVYKLERLWWLVYFQVGHADEGDLNMRVAYPMNFPFRQNYASLKHMPRDSSSGTYIVR